VSTTTTATEAQHQASLFQFLAHIEGQVPAVAFAFHVPNGEKREKATAARLKAMGVKPGVPDILLPVRSRDFVGLALELKRPTRRRERDGGVAPAQERWLDHLEAEGWCCVVAWSWEEAARELLRYLGRDPRDFDL
jgi:hypothetical protein